MEERVSHLEAAMHGLQTDVAVIKSNYATKHDVAELRAELKSDIALLRTELKTELRTEIGMLRGEMLLGFGAIQGRFGILEGAIHKSETSTIRWVVSAVVLTQLIPALPALLKAFKLIPA